MSYTKPLIVPIGDALSKIEGQNKGDCSSDGTHPATVSAYEADE
jgi:hypothetical protein